MTGIEKLCDRPLPAMTCRWRSQKNACFPIVGQVCCESGCPICRGELKQSTQSGPSPICSSNGRFLIAVAVRGNGRMRTARPFLPFELLGILHPLLFSNLALAQKKALSLAMSPVLGNVGDGLGLGLGLGAGAGAGAGATLGAA
jgi:hypothetical protein